jgi:hypothetical protein
MQQVSSPEQLDDYIKVSNPGVWIVLVAILVLFGAAAVWAATAVIPTMVPTKAVLESPGRYVCYMPVGIEEHLKPGAEVQVGNLQGSITRIGETPLSYSNAARTLPNEYTAYALGLSEWNVRVEIQVGSSEEPQAAGTISPVTIITAAVSPLSFLFN